MTVSKYLVRKRHSDPGAPWGVYSEWSRGESISDFRTHREALDYALLLVFLAGVRARDDEWEVPTPPPQRKGLALWFFGKR